MASRKLIFKKWLQEWYNSAKKWNFPEWIVYERCINALDNHQPPVATGYDCRAIPGFDRFAADEIDWRLRREGLPLEIVHDDPEPQIGHADPNPEIHHDDHEPQIGHNESDIENGKEDPEVEIYHDDSDMEIYEVYQQPTMSSSNKNSFTKKSISTQNEHISRGPRNRSGSYAILVALYQKGEQEKYRGYMTRTELYQDGQRHCEKSFTVQENEKSHTTAWRNMRGLTEDGYVEVRSEYPCQYSLTAKGKLQAKNYLLKIPAAPPIESSGVTYPGEVRFQPGEFEIVLFIDICEAYGKNKSPERIKFDKLGIPYEIYRLTVGDFVWVVRGKKKTQNEIPNGSIASPNINSLVLPFVVERKTWFDMSESVKTNRFDDQRQRLKDSKLQVTYVLEGFGTSETLFENGMSTSYYIEKLKNDDKFGIEKTASFSDTMKYLADTTKKLTKQYKDSVMVGFWKSEKDDFKNPGTSTEAHLMFFSDFIDFSCKKPAKDNK